MPSSAAEDSRDRLFALVSFFLLALSACFLSLHVLDDTDLLWHLKTGELIFQKGVPHQDSFSFVAQGREWIDAQWLFQLLIYLVYRAFGFAGLSWLLALTVMVTWLLLFTTGYDRKGSVFSLLPALLSLWAAKQRFNVRPEIFSFFFMAVFFFVLERNRRKPDAGLFLLPLFQLFWVNMEGLWPIGLFIIGVYLLDDFLLSRVFTGKAGEPRRQAQALRLSIALAVCVVAGFVTPYGVRGFFFPVVLFKQAVIGSSALKHMISDLLPPFRHGEVWFLRAPFMVLIFLSGASFFFNPRKFRPAHIILWLVFLLLALAAMRHIALFCVASLVFTAYNVNEFLSAGKPASNERRLAVIKKIFFALGMALSLVFAVDILSGRFYVQERTYRKLGAGFAFEKYPVSACNFLQNIKWKGKIFNQMAMAGYLIWAGYPDWQVYTDGRLELYGPELALKTIEAEYNYSQFLDQDELYHFDAALLNYRLDNGWYLARNLFTNPNWGLVYADQKIVIFLKDSPAQHNLITQYRLNPN